MCLGTRASTPKADMPPREQAEFMAAVDGLAREPGIGGRVPARTTAEVPRRLPASVVAEMLPKPMRDGAKNFGAKRSSAASALEAEDFGASSAPPSSVSRSGGQKGTVACGRDGCLQAALKGEVTEIWRAASPLPLETSSVEPPRSPLPGALPPAPALPSPPPAPRRRGVVALAVAAAAAASAPQAAAEAAAPAAGAEKEPEPLEEASPPAAAEEAARTAAWASRSAAASWTATRTALAICLVALATAMSVGTLLGWKLKPCQEASQPKLSSRLPLAACWPP